MIKIAQDTVSQNFAVLVSKFETIRETFKVASQVQRILAKSGVTTVSVTKQGVEVEFVSYDDTVSSDNVLWALVDSFNVGPGYWDNFGIYIEYQNGDVVVQTNKDGSTIKINHKNAHKLREDEEFPYNFAGGLQFAQFMRDTVRIDVPCGHAPAREVAQDLQDLLDSLD